MAAEKSKWWIYQGNGIPHDDEHDITKKLPKVPPWRKFSEDAHTLRGEQFKLHDPHAIDLVNTSLYLRRPLLVTGKPGTGKTSLAYSVAYELQLGEVLRWSITTRSTLHEGLYHYDAIARLQDASLQKTIGGAKGVDTQHDDVEPPDIGRYLRLGPLGTAFTAQERPYVLLIDEIDKSDIDLPNDLLHIFEEGDFVIPELARLPEEDIYKTLDIASSDGGRQVSVTRGRVRCNTFPLVIMTSNGEREFPPAFKRRCLRLNMEPPDKEDQLREIVTAHLGSENTQKAEALISKFYKRCKDEQQELAADQLLNAVYLYVNNVDRLHREKEKLGKKLLDALWKSLSEAE